MIDIWQQTTDILNEVKDRISVLSDDHLYYELRTNTKKKSIIGTVNKTYDEHVKVVIVQLRDKMWRISANDNNDSIESNIAQMRQEIMTEALVREIEEI